MWIITHQVIDTFVLEVHWDVWRRWQIHECNGRRVRMIAYHLIDSKIPKNIISINIWWKRFTHRCMYNFIRFKFSSVNNDESFSEFLVKFLNKLRFLGVSELFFHSGIWWIVAGILNWFNNWLSRNSAGRSNGCCSLSPVSQRKTLSCKFFQTADIFTIVANCIMNCDVKSKGFLLDGSKMLIGHKSIYLM